MEQHTKLTVVASSSASSGSSPSSSRSIHGSMSSAFLGVSSSTNSQSQRRSSASLCPPLGSSRGSAAAASGGSASAGSSSSHLHQISASRGSVARRRPRPNTQLTTSLPSPFFSELSTIRRISANVFGDLDAQAQEIRIQRPLLHGQQGRQEMTRSSSSSFTMPQSHHHTPNSTGEFSGFQFSSPLQQQQAQTSFSSLQPLPGGSVSGFPLPASQPQHMQPSSSSSSTDLPSRIFSGFEPPVASQHFSSYQLAPLPSGSTIWQSYSSCSADHAQPSSSNSELPPLPRSLEKRQCDLPPLGQLSSTVDQSRPAFVQPSETYELAPLPESLQMPQQQANQEPVAVAPSPEPEIISLDDDDELSAVVQPFASSHGNGSAAILPNSMLEGAGVVGQTSEGATRMPASSVQDKANNGGGSSSSIPWNFSRSEDQALQQLRNLLSRWSSTASSMSSDQSMGSSVAGSSRAAMPAMAKRFDTINIRDSSSSARPQMPCNNYSSLSVQNSNPVPGVPKLILGGMDRPSFPSRQPAVGAGASSSMSPRGCTKEHYFSEAEMENITKDNRLKELVKTDSWRVKRVLRNRESVAYIYLSRVLRNRESVAQLKLRKANHLEDLQRRADALKMECSSLSAQVQSHQEMVDKLTTGNRALQLKLNGLKELDKLKQALNHQLQSELQRLQQGS